MIARRIPRYRCSMFAVLVLSMVAPRAHTQAPKAVESYVDTCVIQLNAERLAALRVAGYGCHQVEIPLDKPLLLDGVSVIHFDGIQFAFERPDPDAPVSDCGGFFSCDFFGLQLQLGVGPELVGEERFGLPIHVPLAVPQRGWFTVPDLERGTVADRLGADIRTLTGIKKSAGRRTPTPAGAPADIRSDDVRFTPESGH